MNEVRTIDWKKVEKQAKKMLEKELIFAYNDCIKCSNLEMPNDGYYKDCASVYYEELRRRKRKDIDENKKIQVTITKADYEELCKLRNDVSIIDAICGIYEL